MPFSLATPARAALAVLPLAAVVAVTGSSAGAAHADEVAVRPPDGVFVVDGHGWGHGRGMSQWGAQGAASLGVSADTITSMYYPGTARAVLPDAPIRVLLSGAEGAGTVVQPADGLAVTDEARGSTAALPAGYALWRVRTDGAQLLLEGLAGSSWVSYAASPGPYSFAGPLSTRVRMPDGSARDYRGRVRAVRSGAAVQTIAVLGLEDYLLGVVPRESPAAWLPAALQAQAIAARSYSAYKRAHAGGSYDICDSTACQVFGGSRYVSPSGAVTELEAASTTAAVHASAGVVRTYGGAPIFAEFSSSNGGWSTAGGAPYLVARADPWDGAVPSSAHSWTGTVTAGELQARFPAVGHLDRLRVTGRDGNGEWGGRVGPVVLEGTAPDGRATSVATTGAGVYGAAVWPARVDGLRSTWWHVRATPSPETVRVVAAMYLDLLGRPADPGGLALYAGRVAEGTMGPRDVALTMGRSPEYTRRLVGALYAAALGRTPDDAGLAGWAAVLQADPSQVSAVAAAMYASDEAYAVAGGDDRRWVAGVYRSLLGREADPAGLAGWAAQVPVRGREFVARCLQDSPESLARRVQALYATLLGRAADPAGLAGWPEVVAGQGDIALAADLAASAEYAARAQGR